MQLDNETPHHNWNLMDAANLDLGPASALTVIFLIPVFGVLWGHIFLGEVVSWHTFVGAAIVILGTALVTGFNPGVIFAKKVAHNA